MSDGPLLLADTMTVSWYVLAPDRLSAAATSILEEHALAGRPISVSAYSVLELVYMKEKVANGISMEEFDAIMEVLEDVEGPFVVVPMDREVAAGVIEVPRRFDDVDGKSVVNADPGDRMIAATALKHDLTIVTCDNKLHSLARVIDNLTVLWQTGVQ